jgi:iron only hydrogenase large subunit-like protein
MQFAKERRWTWSAMPCYDKKGEIRSAIIEHLSLSDSRSVEASLIPTIIRPW